jgi:hypothetical protein
VASKIYHPAPAIVLVGFRVPGGGARDAACFRPKVAAQIPQCEFRNARLHERRDVAAGGADDRLSPQNDCRTGSPCKRLWHSPWPGSGLGILFARRQGRVAYPLLGLTLFRRPTFSATIAAFGLSCLAMFGGVHIFIAQYA